MASDTTSRSKIYSVQYLRAVAAVSVVVYHGFFDARFSQAWPVSLFAAGVDVFFVISGFIMWTTTYGRPMTTGQFWMRRIERIVPLYWLITSVAIVAAVAAPSIGGKTTLEHVGASLAFLPAVNPDTARIEPLVSPGWTLNYEMFFYLLFGGVLLLAPAKRLLATVCGLGALVALGSLLNPTAPLIARFFTDSLVLEFAFGVVLGAVYTSTHKAALNRATAAAIACAGIAWLVIVGNHGGVARVVMFGVPSAALVAAAIFSDQQQAWGRHRLALVLGDASYSIYICHGLVLTGAATVLRHGHAPRPVILILGPVLAIGAGLVVYFKIERPISRFFHARRSPLPRDPDASAESSGFAVDGAPAEPI